MPKGRLFPTSRDELLECAALLDSVRRGELDALVMPPAPLDVLAQQLVAEVACRDWDEDALFALVQRAWPYAALPRKAFDDVVRMLADGYSTRFGQRGAYLHRDAVHRRLRGRKGARLTATLSGGTIPETGDYQVLLEPQAISIGTINEDFAIESIAGDVFQLGNASYRVLRVEAGRVRVQDAEGAPPSIPFWLGEAPGRSIELSQSVSRLREGLQRQLEVGGAAAALNWLTGEVGLAGDAAQQIADYAQAQFAGFGMLPSQSRIALERFFDESGGTQLVIHAPYGSRINKAWGLALRKRFCRKFNFELQAAATEDAIVLSLSTSHSFPLIEVISYLHSASAAQVLVQALLDAPMFPARFRWTATNALALPRFVGGSKVAPQLQRMKSEDLMATVFPDPVACSRTSSASARCLIIRGGAAMHDCLHEAMDAGRLAGAAARLESGAVEVVARDLTGPSPFAAEILGARPTPSSTTPAGGPPHPRGGGAWLRDASRVDDLGRLDPAAIEGAREDAWPAPRDLDEMHQALMQLGVIGTGEAEASGWTGWLEELAAVRRATVLRTESSGASLWVAAERLPQLRGVHGQGASHPPIEVPADYAREWPLEEALPELVRGRLGGMAVTTAGALAEALAAPGSDIELALLALEQEGYVMRGRFTPGATGEEWCERHLLARIHRNTLGRLRREIEAVDVRDYVRFLCDWQRVSPRARASGPDAVAGVVAQLEGFEAAAGAWEGELLPARVGDYCIGWLDELCTAGRVAWTRLRVAGGEGGSGGALVRAAPIVLLPRRELAQWTRLAEGQGEADAGISSRAAKVEACLRERGALFFDELADASRLLHVELEDALAELVARGRASCDSFSGLRALLMPAAKRSSTVNRRGRRASLVGIADAGRWSLTARARPLPADLPVTAACGQDTLEHVARVLLRRYGVVCWRLMEREAPWLPPWRELLRVYQRLEARGEIRGGRFIAGVVGAQFALPEAVAALRSVSQATHDGALLAISLRSIDPLGAASCRDKVPAGARALLRDWVPIASPGVGRIKPCGVAGARRPLPHSAATRARVSPRARAQAIGSAGPASLSCIPQTTTPPGGGVFMWRRVPVTSGSGRA